MAATIAQRFGASSDSISPNGDTITALEFNKSGEYMATGDQDGRIVMFKKGSSINPKDKSSVEYDDWKPFYQFKSHEPEFDYLKSMEVESKINQIKFLPKIRNKIFVMSTNDKTIKLWKVTEKNMPDTKKYVERKISDQIIKFPKFPNNKGIIVHK
jgi:serine/threonine-protein phosphatase 2A regulatory subunit B